MITFHIYPLLKFEYKTTNLKQIIQSIDALSDCGFFTTVLVKKPQLFLDYHRAAIYDDNQIKSLILPKTWKMGFKRNIIPKSGQVKDKILFQ